MSTSIDEQGERRSVGRNALDPSYIRALLSAKIVVVAQKDGWEDHYRLMEALVCGPLVISETMIAPPKGLHHRENIIFFQSLEQLHSQVEYYLAHEEERGRIASAGWNMAMTRHRSWHRMEELLFGQQMTNGI